MKFLSDIIPPNSKQVVYEDVEGRSHIFRFFCQFCRKPVDLDLWSVVEANWQFEFSGDFTQELKDHFSVVECRTGDFKDDRTSDEGHPGFKHFQCNACGVSYVAFVSYVETAPLVYRVSLQGLARVIR